MRLITLVGLTMLLAREASAQWAQSCSDALNGYLRARGNAAVVANLPVLDTVLVRAAEDSLLQNSQVLAGKDCMETLFRELEIKLDASESELWYKLYIEAVYYSMFKRFPPPPKTLMPIA